MDRWGAFVVVVFSTAQTPNSVDTGLVVTQNVILVVFLVTLFTAFPGRSKSLEQAFEFFDLLLRQLLRFRLVLHNATSNF